MDDFIEMRAAGDVNPEKILDLAGGNQHRCAGSESDHHGMGNKIDQYTHARKPHDELKYTHQERHG